MKQQTFITLEIALETWVRKNGEKICNLKWQTSAECDGLTDSLDCPHRKKKNQKLIKQIIYVLYSPAFRPPISFTSSQVTGQRTYSAWNTKSLGSWKLLTSSPHVVLFYRHLWRELRASWHFHFSFVGSFRRAQTNIFCCCCGTEQEWKPWFSLASLFRTILEHIRLFLFKIPLNFKHVLKGFPESGLKWMRWCFSFILGWGIGCFSNKSREKQGSEWGK